MIIHRIILFIVSFLISIVSYSQNKSELDVFKQRNLQFLITLPLTMILQGKRILVRKKFTLTLDAEYAIVL